MLSGSRARVAANQSVFRDINERLTAWPERRQAAATEALSFYCECGDERCFEHLWVTAPDYEAVRGHSARFIVTRGHVMPDAEDVVDEHDGYVVVEKHRDLHPIVEAGDPRRALH